MPIATTRIAPIHFNAEWVLTATKITECSQRYGTNPSQSDKPPATPFSKEAFTLTLRIE